MRCAIYARVSTEDQNWELQVSELSDFIQRQGWERVDYLEKESTRKRRPVLEQLLEDARQKKIDIVLVWKLDRFSRSVRELHENLAALDRAGVRFISHHQLIDTDQRNPVSRLILNILASVAEFERDLIRERTKAGVAEYRRAFDSGRVGKTKSRHSKSGKDLAHGRPKRTFRRDLVAEMRERNPPVPWRQISKELGVPIGTLLRAYQQNGVPKTG